MARMRPSRSSTITPSVAVSRIALSSSISRARLRRAPLGRRRRRSRAARHGQQRKAPTRRPTAPAAAAPRRALWSPRVVMASDLRPPSSMATSPGSTNRRRGRRPPPARRGCRSRSSRGTRVGIEQLVEPIDQHADRQPVEERPRIVCVTRCVDRHRAAWLHGLTPLPASRPARSAFAARRACVSAVVDAAGEPARELAEGVALDRGQARRVGSAARQRHDIFWRRIAVASRGGSALASARAARCAFER